MGMTRHDAIVISSTHSGSGSLDPTNWGGPRTSVGAQTGSGIDRPFGVWSVLGPFPVKWISDTDRPGSRFGG